MSAYRLALQEAVAVFENLRDHEENLRLAAACCSEALNSGHKLLICGNGGSAAEAQHLAGELMGRYKFNRSPLAAVALNADAAVLSCIGNDFCYEEAFSRQVRGLGRPGDVLIVFTTSGRSPNILAALRAAGEMGLKSIGFLGRDGGPARSLVDFPLVVAHTDTARAQEGHQFLMHCLMDSIEAAIPPGR